MTDGADFGANTGQMQPDVAEMVSVGRNVAAVMSVHCFGVQTTVQIVSAALQLVLG